MSSSCKIFGKWIYNVVISLGMFVAIMAFHLISFVVCLLLSSAVVFGLTLAFSYFARKTLPIYVETALMLILLSYLCKYHLVFYYKLIYPGDNYDRACWSFLKKITKLLYAMGASYAFIQIFLEHLRNRTWKETGAGGGGPRSKTDIISILEEWEKRKTFTTSMALLVHLFSVCLYKDYKTLCGVVPILDLRCSFAVCYSMALQSFYILINFIEFYLVHAWVPYSWISANGTLYSALTGVSLVVWVLQVTVCEILTDRLCAFKDKDEQPYYWYQNQARGRVLLLKFLLLPCTICLFYCNYDPDILSNGWVGVLTPEDNSNPTLIFLAFFCATILHSVKTLMLLKNGLARVVYGCWLCYYKLHNLVSLDCCEEDFSDLSDISSGTVAVSELSQEDLKEVGSCCGRDISKKRFSGSPPPAPPAGERAGAGRGLGDGRRADSVDDVQRKSFPSVKTGIGDHLGSRAGVVESA